MHLQICVAAQSFIDLYFTYFRHSYIKVNAFHPPLWCSRFDLSNLFNTYPLEAVHYLKMDNSVHDTI